MSSPGFRPHPVDARLLEGRNALVTGATSGIGAAVARELAAHGAGVAIGFRSHPETAGEMSEQIASQGGRAAPVGIDVEHEDAVVRGFAEAQAALGAIDLVVCNAGVEAPADLIDMSLDDWRTVLEVNLTGLFLCAREAARAMIGHGRGGAIVAVTSVHDRMPWAGFSHYSASKGGQKLFVESIAKELAPHGIRVSAVAPGTSRRRSTRGCSRIRRRGRPWSGRFPWDGPARPGRSPGRWPGSPPIRPRTSRAAPSWSTAAWSSTRPIPGDPAGRHGLRGVIAPFGVDPVRQLARQRAAGRTRHPGAGSRCPPPG